MKPELFDELVASVGEGGAILRGDAVPSRSFVIEGGDVRRIGPQQEFARDEEDSMPLMFRKRIKIAPGVTLNLTQSGVGLTVGPKGLKYTIGPRGQFVTAGIPGSGVYVREKVGGQPRAQAAPRDKETSPLKAAPLADLTASKSARQFREGCESYFAEQYEAALKQFEAVAEGGEYAPDGLLMAGLSAYLLDKPEQAIDHLLGCLDRMGKEQPVPGQPESLAAQHIDDGESFSVPVTRFVSADLPYSALLATFLSVELTQIHGKLDNAIELAEAFQQGIPAHTRRLMQLSLAELYTIAERFDALEDFFEQQVGGLENTDNIAVEMMLYWAATLVRQERYEAAREVYSRALSRTKDRDPLLLKTAEYARADLYARWGKSAEARTYFEKLYAADPSFADVAERVKGLKKQGG